ncbi:MAG: FtsL-like putative cell division protein [Flavobacterium sp.]|jgi:hypothetical protein
MKKISIYDLLKAKYFVNEDAFKNWSFVLFIIILTLMIIANTHSYEKKVYEIARLTREVKQLRSEHFEKRFELMKLKMESNISKNMESRGVYPSETPPVKIRAFIIKEKKWHQKLWE